MRLTLTSVESRPRPGPDCITRPELVHIGARSRVAAQVPASGGFRVVRETSKLDGG